MLCVCVCVRVSWPHIGTLVYMFCQRVTGSDPSTAKKKKLTEMSIDDNRNKNNIHDKITTELFEIQLQSFSV